MINVSGKSIEMEDASEAESRGKSSAPTSPLILAKSKTTKRIDFPLTLLQTQPKCGVYPDLHKIIQVSLLKWHNLQPIC